MPSRSDIPAAVTLRAATPQERIALRAARWPGLPPWVWAVENLRVAVAGRRDFLLGCAWELESPAARHAGCAAAPGNRLAGEAREALAASFHAGPGLPLHWMNWLDAGDPLLPGLLERGFQITEEMLGYEIVNEPATFARFVRGIDIATRRMAGASLTWGTLQDDGATVAARHATLEEGLLSGPQFDFLDQAGEIDRASSPVAWHDGRLAGFIALMAREEVEVLLMVVRPDLRSSGLGALLLKNMLLLKLQSIETWSRVVFRGNPAKNPGSRHLCLRFGGREQAACVKLVLPPLND